MNFYPMESFGYCHYNVIVLRKEPAHRAEQVSQLLLGEKISRTGLEEGNWVEVISLIDNYTGWCLHSQLTPISQARVHKLPKKWVGTLGAKMKVGSGNIQLFAGSDISLFSKNASINGFPTGHISGDIIKPESLSFDAEHLQSTAKNFLGSAYLWGGKTTVGIDCSGLSQMVYRLMGINLPRDASQQATQGETIYFLHEAKAGDLAFFDNEHGNINHVGILLNQHFIIHSTEKSGGVVIDKIDAEGIVSQRLKHRTHRLRTIKRYH